MSEVSNNDYDLLVLDEVHIALDMKLLYQSQYFDFLKNKPTKLEVISTGRVINKELMQKIELISDLHTDAFCKKHYFNTKCPNCKRSFEWHHKFCSNCGSELIVSTIARKGIEM